MKKKTPGTLQVPAAPTPAYNEKHWTPEADGREGNQVWANYLFAKIGTFEEAEVSVV